jgi:hypothetical protein
VTGGERLTGGDFAGEGIVLGVGASRTVGINHPANLGAGHNCSQRTPTESGSRYVVEVLVDALCLPLAIQTADHVGQLFVVAGGVADRTLKPLA